MSSFRDRIEYSGILLTAWFFRFLPFGLARGTARLLGWIAAHVLKLRRKVALRNLRASFPQKDERELRSIYYGCWKHFLRVGAEMARLPRIDETFIERWVDLSQQTVLREALELGKGAIIVSGHFGNWEWMGGCMSKIGYPVTYVVTSQSNRLTENWMNRMRESVNIEIIHRRDAVRGVLSALKRNRAVAILCDQDAGDAGVFVQFFGRPASTPRGPALFHIKTGVPIIFVSAPRTDEGRYRILFERMVFDGLSGDRDHDEQFIMQKVTARLEEEVRQYPEQWLWLHRRWKSAPPR